MQMRKLLLLVMAVLFFAGQLFAQKTITGRVTDDKGNPIANASIVIKGTTAGTVTSADGTYSVAAPAGAKTLVISSVGSVSQEFTIGSQSIINCSLKPEEGSMQELMVVAYGTQKKEAFTGSASVVKADVIKDRPVTSFEKALQGSAAGVTVQSVSGQPGAATVVRIRGVGSFSASNTPLYVLDGVAIESGDLTQATTTATALSSLDPNDIESITVLKDASAAALYGSRAANGVILITTKKGKSGVTRFNAYGNKGYSSIVTPRHELMSGEQYFKYWWDYYYATRIAAGDDAATAAAKANSSTITNLGANIYNNANPYDAQGNVTSGTTKLYDTDWRGAVTQTGVTSNYGIDVSGGNDKSKFYISGSYFDQKGIILASNFKRYNAKINLDNTVNNFLKIGVNSTLNFTDQNTPAGAGGAANPIRFSEIVAGVYPMYKLNTSGQPEADPLGGFLYNYSNPVVKDYNPVGLAQKNMYNVKTIRGIVSAFAELSFTKDLKFKTNGAVDVIDIRETLHYYPLHGDGAGVKGRTTKYAPRNMVLNLTNTLVYDKRFDRHGLNVLLGQEAIKYKYENLYAGATTFPFEGMVDLDNAATPVSARSSMKEKRMTSYFSRLNYSYNDRYYVSGSLRQDGSSVFGSNNRWGTFWSVGGAWRLSRESFMSNIDWINDLKLRASYGISGNDRIGEYDRLGLYRVGANYQGQGGTRYSQLANPDLSWEGNTITDIGVEFNIFKRIKGELSYYNRGSDGILFKKPLSRTTGFNEISTNLASMKNYGFEGMVEARAIEKKDFSWTVSLNLTTNHNEIVKMTVDSIVQGTTQRWKVGTDRYQWYIRDYAGVDPTDGRPTWYKNEIGTDGKPTGKIITTKDWNAADRYEKGSALPKFYGGFTNRFNYKDFDLSVFVFFNYGNKIYDSYLAQLMHSGANRGSQLATEAYKAWKKPGDVTDVPRFTDQNTDLGNNSSTRFLVDGSYIRVKSLTLGYNLSREITQRLKLGSARFYVSAENILTFYKHKGLDPEVNIDGLTENDIPNVKTISVGINLGF